MKNIRNFMLWLIPLFLIGGCTNLDSIYKSLDDHERRLNELDKVVKVVNDDVQRIQKLIDAEKTKVKIIGYRKAADGKGYILTMSDGTTMIIGNTKDGTTPVVGVKRYSDGVLYWTINGEFMTDADGKMIVAEGQDGEAGATPMLQVNADGFWEVSLDGGKTYTLILDDQGQPIPAKGETPKVDFSIEETDDSIIIHYNGNTFVLPKSDTIPIVGISFDPATYTLAPGKTLTLKPILNPANTTEKEMVWKSSSDAIATVSQEGVVTGVAVGKVTITATSKRGDVRGEAIVVVQSGVVSQAKLPIEFVAEYNMNDAGTGFVTSHANNKSGYFDWDHAMKLYKKEARFKLEGQGYYLPSMYEWSAVIPFRNVYFIEKDDVLDQNETFEFQGKTRSLRGDYKFPGNNVAYAIRFKGDGDLIRSAYRFEYTANPDGVGKALIITARYLGPEQTGVTIEDIAKSEYWSTDNDQNIVRVFPCAGYKLFDSGEIQTANVWGSYWASTEHDWEMARRVLIGPRDASSNDGAKKIDSRSIRLFKIEFSN